MTGGELDAYLAKQVSDYRDLAMTLHLRVK
jgi:hypothetical protein